MYSRILVPLDGSKNSEKAIPHAEGLAKSSGAEIHLMMIFTRHPGGGNPTGTGLESDSSVQSVLEISRQLEDAQIEKAEEYLEHIAIRLRDEGFQVTNELEEGSPHEHIVDYAKKNGIDLVVMATHGHGGIRRWILGSTTDRVIRACEVPVMAIPCV